MDNDGIAPMAMMKFSILRYSYLNNFKPSTVGRTRVNNTNFLKHCYSAGETCWRDTHYNKQDCMETDRAATHSTINYDGWTNFSRADVSKAWNSLTAEATASPSFTASSLLGAWSVIAFSYTFNSYSRLHKLEGLLYLNVKGKNGIMKWKSKKEPPAITRNSNLF